MTINHSIKYIIRILTDDGLIKPMKYDDVPNRHWDTMEEALEHVKTHHPYETPLILAKVHQSFDYSDKK